MRNAWVAVGLFVAATGCATPPKSAEELELEAKREEIARLESQLDARHRALASKKRFVSGQRAGQFQDYVSACLATIIRLGNLNIPDEVRGKLYGRMQLTFSIRADGTLEGVETNKGSGHTALDRTMLNAVRLSAPFNRFPSTFPREVEVLSVTQSFEFVQNDQGGRIEP